MGEEEGRTKHEKPIETIAGFDSEGRLLPDPARSVAWAVEDALWAEQMIANSTNEKAKAIFTLYKEKEILRIGRLLNGERK